MPGSSYAPGMPSTYGSLLCHVVFSTRNRLPQVAPEWRARLHGLLGHVALDHDARPLEVGGVADHVHILLALRPVHCLGELMRAIKRDSSRWVHDTIGLASFAWQEGYGYFGVSPDGLEDLRRYIREQEAHHRKRTFQQEFVALLQAYGVEYEEKYLW